MAGSKTDFSGHAFRLLGKIILNRVSNMTILKISDVKILQVILLIIYLAESGCSYLALLLVRTRVYVKTNFVLY